LPGSTVERGAQLAQPCVGHGRDDGAVAPPRILFEQELPAALDFDLGGERIEIVDERRRAPPRFSG
jgi:hypothetical protein